jgi:hypothetical protein
MYFAVQAMAAELFTGALVMFQIQKVGRKISLLQITKETLPKATGQYHFTCDDGHLIEKAIRKPLLQVGQTFG